MSEPRTAPAGWYPEPSGTTGQRWWDGTGWTEYATPLEAPPLPYGQAMPERVPEGTPVDTLWIWLLVVLPVVSLIPFFLWDFEGYMLASMTDPLAQARAYLDPMYLASVLLGWVGYGLSVVFAYLDFAALKRSGYPRPFHWAWAFLWLLVYIIGRSVVVKRRSGHGTSPMWVAIALNVVLFVGVFVWTGVVIANVVNAMLETYPGI